MERSEQRRIVEALVLASPEPLTAARIAEMIPYVKPGKAKDLINELNTEYQEQDRAFEIWEVAGGYQMRTRAEFSGYMQKLQRQRPLRLSRASLETLSIIAYKQPATRAEIEEVRGCECGPVVKSLLDRHLVRIAGHREVPGRPMLYGTTRRFLEVFGLESLKGLPALRDLDEIAREQGLAGDEDAPEAEAAESGDAASADPAETSEDETAAVDDALAAADSESAEPSDLDAGEDLGSAAELEDSELEAGELEASDVSVDAALDGTSIDEVDADGEDLVRD